MNYEAAWDRLRTQMEDTLVVLRQLDAAMGEENIVTKTLETNLDLINDIETELRSKQKQ